METPKDYFEEFLDEPPEQHEWATLDLLKGLERDRFNLFQWLVIQLTIKILEARHG